MLHHALFIRRSPFALLEILVFDDTSILHGFTSKRQIDTSTSPQIVG
jgi:hypothetical protein